MITNVLIPKNSAMRSQTLALSLMVSTAARIQILATTVFPAPLATRDLIHLDEVWSKLLLINRLVEPCLCVKQLTREKQNKWMLMNELFSFIGMSVCLAKDKKSESGTVPL